MHIRQNCKLLATSYTKNNTSLLVTSSNKNKQVVGSLYCTMKLQLLSSC